MDSAKNDLLAALVGTSNGLGLIDGTGDYDNELKTISRDIVNVTQLSGQFPAAILLATGEPKTRDESAITLIRSLQVQILLYVQNTVTTANAMSIALNSLAAEVKFALIHTTRMTHGATCMLSFFDDMDEIGLVHEGIGAALMQFHFVYKYKRDTP